MTPALRLGLGCAAALLLAAACNRDNSLEGSLDQLFPLAVSRVDVIRAPEAFQVSYYANRQADIDLVARLTVYVGDVEIDGGLQLPLQGEYSPGHPRTSVVHLAAGEAQRVLPRVERGDLVIDEGGNVGDYTRGNFSVLFERGDLYGGGRTLSGWFSGEAADGGYDILLGASPDQAP